MKRFEYLTENALDYPGMSDIRLFHLGQLGWELVTILVIGTKAFKYIFKREINE